MERRRTGLLEKVAKEKRILETNDLCLYKWAGESTEWNKIHLESPSKGTTVFVPQEKKDKMAVSRGYFSDMAIGTHVVMTVIAENTGIYSRSMVWKQPYWSNQ